MIRTNISAIYPNHINKYRSSNTTIYIADYTEQTKALRKKRGVEIFNTNPPTDINFFTLANNPSLEIGYIDFDNSSFVCSNGKPRSQCECVVFPHASVLNSWVLFSELKYSPNPKSNSYNLNKAIKQLYKTRYYYVQNNIISKKNTSYLIASLPLQTEPFLNFSLTPAFLIKLKSKKNIVLKRTNNVEIINGIHIQ
jgi:hypothetical protein